MHARLTTKPEQEVIAAIQSLDLNAVKVRIMDAELGEGWTREYADSIEAAYKTYLTMLVKYPDDAENIMLSEDVDEFWHTHILQTIKYAEDCQKVFGNFLHHEPHVGEITVTDLEKRSALAEKTRGLYAREFGEAQDAAWSGYAIKPEHAAYSAASIRPQNAAYCGVAVRTEKAAYCGAAVRTEKAAYCGAAIRTEKAAYCGAAIRTESAAQAGSPQSMPA